MRICVCGEDGYLRPSPSAVPIPVGSKRMLEGDEVEAPHTRPHALPPPQVLVDGEVKTLGSLMENLEPSINPPAMIPDVADMKPKDWADTPT